MTALLVALRRPDLVDRLVLASGGFHRECQVPGADQIDVDQVVEAFGSMYAEVSPDGEEHFPVVVQKVAEMALREPELAASELAGVQSRTLVMCADDDIITFEHTLEPYRGIADSELAVVPGTSHFLIQEKPELCNTLILDFLTHDPVPTVAPVRRAT